MLELLLAVTEASPEIEASSGPVAEVIQTFGIKWPILFAQIANFVIAAILLWKFALKPVIATVEERQQKIADGLQYAEEMKSRFTEAEKQKVETLNEASCEASKILSEAREQATALQKKQAERTARQTATMLEKAQQAIQIEREKVLADVQREVAHLVVQTTAKVLGKTLSDAEKATFSESAAREITARTSTL